MNAKNMYQFLDGLYRGTSYQIKRITIDGEQISTTLISFLRNDLRLCRERGVSINDLRNGLETDYNKTSIKSILLEKKLLEFLLKI